MKQPGDHETSHDLSDPYATCDAFHVWIHDLDQHVRSDHDPCHDHGLRDLHLDRDDPANLDCGFASIYSNTIKEVIKYGSSFEPHVS